MHRPQQTSLSNSSFTIWTTWTRCSQVSESPQNAKLWQERDKKRNLVLILSWLCEAMSRWCIFFRSVPQCCATWAQKSFREHFASDPLTSGCGGTRSLFLLQVTAEFGRQIFMEWSQKDIQNRPETGCSKHEDLGNIAKMRDAAQGRGWSESMWKQCSLEWRNLWKELCLHAEERIEAHIKPMIIHCMCVCISIYIYCLLYITSFNKQKVWFAILHLEMLAIFRYITSNIYKCRYWHEFLRAISIVIVVVKLVQCTVISVV